MAGSRYSPQYPSTIHEAIRYGADQFSAAKLFFGHGTDNAEDEALWLAFHALSLSFDSDASILEQPLAKHDWDTIAALFKRRVHERIPAAYITGRAWFCGYPFKVTEDVLVPRSPVAELIQQRFQPWLNEEPQQVLDLCTGCGCIGIAIALSFIHAQVDVTDISEAALAVAQDNIDRYELGSRVTPVHSDLFSELGDREYDLIVSNPPYVDIDDLSSMPSEYQAEPAIALGSGEDGLDITRRMLLEAAHYLKDDGLLIVEVGNSWVNLEAAFSNVPFFWLDLEHGGHGIFLIRRAELMEYQAEFA